MSDDNPLAQVQAYRKLVLLYEALDKEIDDLLMSHGGHTENMTSSDLERYRELAEKRSDVQNQMYILEQLLSIDEDTH